jgi:hypothetical protein
MLWSGRTKSVSVRSASVVGSKKRHLPTDLMWEKNRGITVYDAIVVES